MYTKPSIQVLGSFGAVTRTPPDCNPNGQGNAFGKQQNAPDGCGQIDGGHGGAGGS